MKKAICLLLCFSFVISFCSCGTDRPESSDTQEIFNSKKYDDSESTNHVESQKAEIGMEPTQLAAEVLCEITDISEEWLPGRYLVYGLDFYGASRYGVLDVNGGFEELNGYAVYFPLAAGNLLVTNDPDVEPSLRTASHKTTDISHGKIIDSKGSILFEAAENQRMHIINSTVIMIIEASSGFDGASLKYGLIDHEGNWLRNLDNNDQLSDFLINYIAFDVGSMWNYTSDISIVRCDGYDDLESQSLVFYKADYSALIYSLRSNSFFEIVSYDNFVIQASANEWLLFSSGWANVPWGGDSRTYKVFDANGREIDSFKHYHATINGIRYWNDYKWKTSVDENNNYTEKEYLVIGSDLNPEGYTFSSDYTQKIYRIAGFTENQIWLVVRGADGRLYFASHDMEGNTIVEPYLLDGFVGGDATVIENQLVCYDYKESFSAYTLNPVSNSFNVCSIGVEDYPEDIWSMGNGLFALKFCENSNDYIFVCSLDGECIYRSVI